MQLCPNKSIETSCSDLVPFQRQLLTCKMITLMYDKDDFCTLPTFCQKRDVLGNFLKILLQVVFNMRVIIHGASYFKFTSHLNHFLNYCIISNLIAMLNQHNLIILWHIC